MMLMKYYDYNSGIETDMKIVKESLEVAWP